MLATLYILTFNHEHLVADAIAGAFSQTYSPLEIIISDDCSTDATWSVIESCTAHYRGPHRLVIRRTQRNLGISAHINDVWSVSNGEWIVASAGDDISLPDRVKESLVAATDPPGTKLVQSWLNEVDEMGRLVAVNTLGVGQSRTFGLADRIGGRSPQPHGAAMTYSRELIDFFGPLPQMAIFEDNVLNLRAELLGELLLLAQPLVNHRNHPGQITRVRSQSSRAAQHERIAGLLTSDIKTAEQNLADLRRIEGRLPDAEWARAVTHFERRLTFCKLKRDSLLAPWPVRLAYLAKIAPYIGRRGSFLRDHLARSLLPDAIYYRLKR